MGGSSSCPLASSAATSSFSCQTDSEMEFSEASHFSILDESATSSNWSPKANYEYFAELQNHPEWGRFFEDWGQEIRVGKKISHGAQADIYEARYGEDGEFNMVVKVMKGDVPLQAFQVQWPIGLLTHLSRSRHFLHDSSFDFNIQGILLEEERLRGRFAFLMLRQWGDLRLLIDRRMKVRRSTNGPFSIDHATYLMLRIAKNMDTLHTKYDIVHRDLKASNVLVDRRSSHGVMIQDEVMFRDEEMVEVQVADFESSRLVMGTSFWRAPEILQQVKNRVPSAEVTFTTMADVYSYGMTCYEIVTGHIPFYSEIEACTWDEILSGRRPALPSEVPLFLKNIIERCWHPDPKERPNFYEIVELLKYKPKTPKLLECRQSHPSSIVIDNEIHESVTIIKVEQWRHCLSLTLIQVLEELGWEDGQLLRASTSYTEEKVVYHVEVGVREGEKLCDTSDVPRIERGLRRMTRKIFQWDGRYIQNDVIKQTYVLEITIINDWLRNHYFIKFTTVCGEVGLEVFKAETRVGNDCVQHALLVHSKEDCGVDFLLKGLASKWVECYIVFHKLVTGDADIHLENFKRVLASFCPSSMDECPFERAMTTPSRRRLKYVLLERGNIHHTDAINVLRQSGYCSGSSSTEWIITSWLSNKQEPQHDKDLVRFRGLPLFFKSYCGEVTSICLRRRALQRISM